MEEQVNKLGSTVAVSATAAARSVYSLRRPNSDYWQRQQSGVIEFDPPGSRQESRRLAPD